MSILENSETVGETRIGTSLHNLWARPFGISIKFFERG
jgi:hypothetical protein